MDSAESSLARTSFFVSETTTAFFDLVEAANLSVERGFSFGFGGLKPGAKAEGKGDMMNGDGWDVANTAMKGTIGEL
jgi:hypothetical protein